MRNERYAGALTTVALLLLPVGMAAAQQGATGFASTVSARPAKAKAGRPTVLSVSLANKSAALAGGIVDVEVYNGRGAKVAQHVWQGQSLTRGRKSYTWGWTPAAAGVYTVKVGVFGANWKPVRHWNDRALAVTVA